MAVGHRFAERLTQAATSPGRVEGVTKAAKAGELRSGQGAEA